MSRVFSAIPDPTTTPESLREAILALKSAVEALTRQTNSSDEDFLAELGLSPIAASGNSSDLLNNWTAYTPVITASSGTFTTVSATGHYLTIGKITFVHMEITITTAGTAAGYLLARLPSAPIRRGAGSGRECNLTGFALSVQFSQGGYIDIAEYDNSTTIASGALILINGSYENA